MNNNTILSNGLFDWQALALYYFLEHKFDMYLFTGGYGSGKSALSIHFLSHFATLPGKRILTVGATYPFLLDTLKTSIDDEIPIRRVKHFVKSPRLKWVFTSRDPKRPSDMLAKYCQFPEDSKKLKSINADALYLPELTKLPKTAFTDGIGRLRKSGKDEYYPIFADTNPSSKSHWVWKLFLEDAVLKYTLPDGFSKFYVKKIKTVSGRELKILVISTELYANPNIPQMTIDNIFATYSTSEIQRYVYGNWVAGEGRIWKDYKTFKIDIDRHKYAKKYDRIFMGGDPGQDHPTAIAFIGFANGVYEVFDEILLRNRSPSQINDEIQIKLVKWGIEGRQMDLWMEPGPHGKAWRKVFQEIINNIYCNMSSHKGSDPTMFRVDMLIHLLKSERLIVNEACVNCIQDLEQAQYKDGAIKEQLDKKKYDPHCFDAVGYAMIKEAV